MPGVKLIRKSLNRRKKTWVIEGTEMEMMIAMFSPILALGLFLVLPFGDALQLYIPIFLFGAFIDIKMMTSMMWPVKTGLEEMIGEEAWVVEEVNPEGKVRINGELWNARTKNKGYSKGDKAKIIGAQGLVLLLE
jgi:membrane-bound ClpP family serine protease